MRRKTNRLFLGIGAVSILLVFVTSHIHGRTGSPIAYHLVGVFAMTGFVFFVILGIMPWVASLGLKYPIHNTQGYRDDYAAEPEKEAGRYWSQGWRRKRERLSSRNTKALGLYIEPDEKS